MTRLRVSERKTMAAGSRTRFMHGLYSSRPFLCPLLLSLCVSLLRTPSAVCFSHNFNQSEAGQIETIISGWNLRSRLRREES